MSDLSRLLDDVYGDAGPDAGIVPGGEPAATGLPDWAIDSVLDAAFSDWVPEDQAGATGAAGGVPAAGQLRPGGSPFGAAPAAQADPHAWSRADDDILPDRRARGGRRTKGGSAPAPEPVAAATPDEAPPERVGRRLSLRRG